MSEVLRSTTFQLAFNGNDGLTGIRTFTKAVTDADKTVEELNRRLGENATVTYSAVRSKKELTAEAIAATREMERNAKSTDRLTQHYKFLASTVGKTADEIEQLNAANALGANASEAQRQQVIQQVQQYQQLRGSVEGAQGSMRNFRGIMQNVGWQAQDTAVQLQMGTSAFVVFSQQGSQIASAFGPTGALIGALIAVGGVVGGTLYKSLNSATGAMERLDKITKEYTEYLSISSKGITELSAKFENLARFSKLAADEQLRLARGDVLQAQTESIAAITNEIQSFNPKLWEGIYGSEKELGLTTRELTKLRGSIIGLSKGVNENSLQSYLVNVSKINPQAKGAAKGVDDLKQKLLDQYFTLSQGIKLLDDTSKGWEKVTDGTTDSLDKITKAFQSEYMSLVKQTETTQEEYDRRKKIIDDYAASEKANQEQVKESYDNLNKWKKQEDEKAGKERERIAKAASNKIITAFNTEYLALTKQTESVNQEYERRKVIIDNYVTEVGRQDEKSKAAYEALDQWKAQQLDKEFDTLVKSLVKRTNTIQEEYDRQKVIIDNHVARVGSVDSDAAEAYAALEKWKTDRLRAEYDSRESIRRRIENAQIRSRRGEDPVGAENDLFATNMKTLNDQKAQLGEEQLEEQTRINALIEGEQLRHNRAMDAAQLQSYQNVVAVASMASQQLTSLADLMSTGVADVQNKVKEMNGIQKAMFLISQTIAAAQAFIQGISLGSQLAALFPLAAPAMIALGTGIGAAQAGAIAGVTIAGAFDKGGNIPAGQAGIVSEYGDELVNGVLVKGPARVTSREETAQMMNQGSNVSLKISIENQIPGAVYEQQQISADEVRIIARQEMKRGMDEAVSNVISNNNSKSAKALRSSYNVQRKL